MTLSVPPIVAVPNGTASLTVTVNAAAAPPTDPVLDFSLPDGSQVRSAGFPPHLENLEKQDQTWKTWKNRGFWGKNLEKYCKTWRKKI